MLSMGKLFPVLFVLLVFFVAACGSGNTSTPQKSKYCGALKVGLASDAITLDPLQSSALVDRRLC
jgi:hypothetical protein